MKRAISLILTVALAVTVGLVAAACNDKPSAGATEYTVTFDYNYDGAPAPAEQTVKSGEKATKPTDPTRSGYRFNGWHYLGVAYDFNAEVTADITVEAYWKDASAVEEPAAVTYGVRFIDAEGVTYDFGGSKPETAVKDSSLRFAVSVSPYYTGEAVVKANGEVLQKDADGAYATTVTSDVTVTVEGLKKDTSRMTGSGTESNPYVISRPIHWIEFVRKANDYLAYSSMHYELGADIDFRGETIPMVDQFTGTLDGKGHKISNYSIQYSESVSGMPEVYTMVGLFQYIAMASVRNLTLENYMISVTSNSVVRIGGLAGTSVSSDIIGCNVSGEIYFTNTHGYYFYVGGVVGHLATGLSGYGSAIMFANVDVDIYGDATGFAGGVAGSVAGMNAQSPSYIANCAVTGNFSVGHAGGIVGSLEAYSSVTDSYFVGSIAADTSEFAGEDAVAGGIAGSVYGYETVIDGCFSMATLTVESSDEQFNFSGEIFTSTTMTLLSDVAATAVPSLVRNSYYVRGEEFVTHDGKTATEVLSHEALLQLMHWDAGSWTEGQTLYPTVNASGYSETKFAYSVLFPGYKIANRDADKAPFDGRYDFDNVRMYMPVCWLFGNNAVGVYMDMDNPNNLSTGFYLDAQHKTPVPSAYLLRKNSDPIYMGFVNYTEVQGTTVYFTAGEDRYELTLGVNGSVSRARFTQGAHVETTTFVLYEDGRILLLSAPTALSSGVAWLEEEDGVLVLAGVRSQGNSVVRETHRAYLFNEYIGTWYSGNKAYTFDFDRTGKITDGTDVTEFTYEETDHGVTLTVGDQVYALTLSGNKEQLTGSITLSKEDNFRGKYESDMYTWLTAEFDGRGTGYSVANGKATTTDGKVYGFDENGFLYLENGNDRITFGLAGGMEGIWYDAVSGYSLILSGISSEGYGYALDSLGNIFMYAEHNGRLIFSVGATDYASAIVHANSDRLQTTLSYTMRDKTVTLVLDDDFRGIWYAEDADALRFTFGFGEVQVGTGASAQTVNYTYNSAERVTFSVGSTTYTAVYVNDNEITVNGVSYKRRDLFAAYAIMNADGSRELQFNGLGEIDMGVVTVYTAANPRGGELEYSVSEDGLTATVYNANGSVWLTVTYDTETKLYTVQEGTRSEEYGVSNVYTGEWSVQGSMDKFSVGVLNEDFSGSAVWTYVSDSGTTRKVNLNVRYDEEDAALVLYTSDQEWYRMYSDAQDGMILSGDDGEMAMAHTDEVAGYWRAVQGTAMMYFDGSGLYGEYGVCLYSSMSGVQRLYYGISYELSDNGIAALFMASGGSLNLYSFFELVPAADYAAAQEIYAQFKPDVFRSDDNSMYLFVIGVYADDLTALTFDDGRGNTYSFEGSRLSLDATMGIAGFNYVTIGGSVRGTFAYEITAQNGNTYTLALYSSAKFGRGDYTPAYTAEVTVNEDGIVSVGLTEFDEDVIFADLYA